MNGPADIGYVDLYRPPDPLDTRQPPPPLEDDSGLPPLMQSLLDETNPDIARWTPAFGASTVRRYHEADVIILTAEVETVPQESIPPHAPPLIQIPPQPAWAREMERKATPDEVVTRRLQKMDEAAIEELDRPGRWKRFKNWLSRVFIDQ